MKPAACQGDLHTCADNGPNTNATLLIETGSPNIFFNGRPAARVGDKVSCRFATGKDALIAEGAPAVFLNGRPAARMGDRIQNGGSISTGSNTVFIGDQTGAKIWIGDDIQVRFGNGCNVYLNCGSPNDALFLDIINRATDLLQQARAARGDVMEDGTPVADMDADAFAATIDGNTKANMVSTSVHENTDTTSCCENNVKVSSTVDKIPCATLWKDIDRKTREIASIEDPVARNKYISAAYAKLYQQHTELTWAGVAAFASKQVGCTMHTAQNSIGAKGADALQDANASLQLGSLRYAGAVDPMARVTAIETHADNSKPGKHSLKSLGNGNKAVFEDIYPALLFYSRYGFDKLKSCAGTHVPPVNPKIINALEQIELGNIDDGNKAILRHEQEDILQPMYNDPYFKEMLNDNKTASNYPLGQWLGAQPMRLSLTAACQGEPEIPFKGNNIANLEERYAYASSVVDAFNNELVNNPTVLREQLNLIIKNT